MEKLITLHTVPMRVDYYFEPEEGIVIEDVYVQETSIMGMLTTADYNAIEKELESFPPTYAN
jgi:hypothetical protein